MNSSRCVYLAALLLVPSAVFAQSARPGLGAVPYNGGVTFRTWAPNAESLAVGGDFNDWHAVPMARDASGGTWSLDVPGARAGQHYKYFINDKFWRRDPRTRQVAGRDGVIYDPAAFDWGDAPIPQPAKNDIVIYEIHPGTFAGGQPPATLDDAIPRLDHVRDLGVNVLLLMPVNEFPGRLSWGYNPSDLFAVESDYGGPDALKRFVRAAHERGMAVFMDVIHNHYGPDELDLWRFDGWSRDEFGGSYFYNDIRANTPWGPTRPDFGRPEVRAFIRDQIWMYLDEYRIGGFRWDSVFNILICEQGANPEGVELLAGINAELEAAHPEVMRTAEDHAFDHNMHFDNLWDVSHRWALYRQLITPDDNERDMDTVADTVAGGPGLNRVIFTEAHDYIAAAHGRSRVPSMIQPDDPESLWARKRALLGAAMLMTTPGVPMIFQGQDMFETQAFQDDTPLDWSRAAVHADTVRAYTDLIHLRRNLSGTTPGLQGAGVKILHVDRDRKVVAWARWNKGAEIDPVLIVANFSNTDFNQGDYAVPFPAAGTWHCRFNSDSRYYGDDFGDVGAVQVDAAGDPPVAVVDLGRYSLQIFSRALPEVPPFGIAANTEAGMTTP